MNNQKNSKGCGNLPMENQCNCNCPPPCPPYPVPVDINIGICEKNNGCLLLLLQTYTTKVLKPNISGCCKINLLTQCMLSCEDCKYVIKWDFDLGGQTIKVPRNCILEFDGGSLNNGTIVGLDTVFINVGDVTIWGENLIREGTWREHSGGGGSSEQIQSDWNQTDSSAKDYIKNKPTIPAAQVQSDWNQTNTTAADYIKNKPTIPSGVEPATSTPLMDGIAAVGTQTKFARGDHRHPSDTSKQDTLISGTNIKTINNLSILGSGNIEVGGGGIFTQEQSDWSQTDNTKVDYIKNKPNLAAVATSGSYDDLINKPTIPSGTEATTTTPLMDGVASVGTETKFARGDHRHPSDTAKQDKLISGQNIATINNLSLLNGGNIEISGGGSITVDSDLSTSSTNPVQNKVITNALNEEHARINLEISRAANAEDALNTRKADKADTLSGYGITDAYTKETTDNRILASVTREASRALNAENLLDLQKADKATTLEGYGISDAYTKLEVRGKILEEKERAEDVEQSLLDLYSGLTESDIVVLSATDPWPVANPQPKTIYRVAGTTSYSDYMFKEDDLVNPVLMATYDNALDEEPTKDSTNLVRSGGVAAVYGTYEENPQWLSIALDSEKKILFGIDKEGNFYFGAGVPRQIREKYVEIIEGKGLIDKEFADKVTYVENPEFLKVWLDNSNNIILAVRKDGDIIFGKGIPSQIVKEFNKVREEIAAAYEHMETKVDKLSSSMNLPERDTVFVTYDNIVAKFEEYGGGFAEGGGEYFYFSDDVGATWSEPVDNTLGNDPVLKAAYNANQIKAPWDIVHAKIFSDGSILLFTYFKCFYTKDYLTFTECSIYDYKPDDEPGLPPIYDMLDHFGNIRHGFYTQSYHDKYLFHNGVEMEVFGEYRTEDSPNVLPREYLETRMWYTVYTPGQPPVIKCAFKSGTTEIDGRVINIRHFHSIAYCEANGKFYIGTGDEEAGVISLDHNEIYFIEASYDVPTDKWTFRIIGEGYRYKFGYMWFDEKYAYIITDYTLNHYEEYKGILRCPIDGLDDINNYKNIYTCPSKDWGEIAVTNIAIDNDGNKVLFPDYLGKGLMWASNSAFNFKKVSFNRNILLGYDFTGPNLNGDIYATNSLAKNNYCYNLTKMFRENGIPDFFKTTIKFK